MNSNQSEAAKPHSPSSVTSVDDCLDILVAWTEGKVGKSYFVRPLEEFQSKFGKVNPEDDFYQARMNYFLEYCVLEYPMSLAGRTQPPVAWFFEENPHVTSGEDKAAELWRAFCGFRHGLFQVLKTGSESIVVKDLIADKDINIQSKTGETLRYLRRKSIFQGYIFGHHNQYHLGQGIILHPELAMMEIIKFVRNHRKYPRFETVEIARRLALTNMRYLRMQHVNPAAIYQAISL